MCSLKSVCVCVFLCVCLYVYVCFSVFTHVQYVHAFGYRSL